MTLPLNQAGVGNGAVVRVSESGRHPRAVSDQHCWLKE